MRCSWRRASVPQGGPWRVLVEFVVQIVTPVPDAQPPREVFDLFFRGAGEVSKQRWQSRHRDPVRIERDSAAGRFEVLENGHDVGEKRALDPDSLTVFGQRFAVIPFVYVHGHVAQPVDQHVQQPDVEPPARAHLDQYEIAGVGRPQHRTEIMQVTRLRHNRTLADELVVQLPGD